MESNFTELLPSSISYTPSSKGCLAGEVLSGKLSLFLLIVLASEKASFSPLVSCSLLVEQIHGFHSLKQKHRHCEFSGFQYLSVFLPTHTEQMDVYSPLVHLSFEDFWLIFDRYDWTRHFGLDVVLYGWFYLLPLWKCVLQFFLALPSDAFLDLLFLFRCRPVPPRRPPPPPRAPAGGGCRQPAAAARGSRRCWRRCRPAASRPTARAGAPAPAGGG